MAYAQKTGGAWRPLAGGDRVVHGDVVASYDSILLWTDAERVAFGVFEIQPGDPPPAGMRIASTSVGDQNGRPVWIDTFEPVPPVSADPSNFIPVPMLRQRIKKLGMWEDFAAYLAQNPAEMLEVLTTESGVDPSYPAIGAAFDIMNVPQAARDYILASPSAGVPDAPVST